MSPHIIVITTLFSTLLFTTYSLPILPNPDSVTQTPLPVFSSPPATIPAFSEQSDAAGCPLDLNPRADPNPARVSSTESGAAPSWPPGSTPPTPDRIELAREGEGEGAEVAGVRDASAAGRLGDLSRLHGEGVGKQGHRTGQAQQDVRRGLLLLRHKTAPVQLPGGILRGKLVGGEKVKRLESDCVNIEFPGLGGCSKCLSSLSSLNGDKAKGTDKTERTSKMRSRDCELMGLSWLLHKHRSAYIHTVSAVLRALMLNTADDVDPTFCSLNSDDMPLAIDSSEIGDGQSSSNTLEYA